MVAVADGERRAPEAGPAAAPGDPLLMGLIRLAGEQGQSLSLAQLMAAAPVPDAGADLRTLVRIAERVGFRVRVEAASRRRLAKLPTPFLLVGRQPGEAWHVRERDGRTLALAAPATLELHDEPISALARRRLSIVRLQAAPAEARPAGLRQAVTSRLRRPLGEIAIASVTINLLALATPIFMMTVYNKVINHSALQTLDVLAIGMVSLVAFELLLRSIRGLLASHAGARLDAAIGAEVIHHLVQMPYRAFERLPSGQLMERLRQLDQLRQFLTGHLPLMLVDLAFVGLFLLAMLLLSPVLAAIALSAMPLFLLVSVLAERHQGPLQQESSRAAAAKASCLNETVSNALTVKALGLEAELERRFERRLVESAIGSYRSASLGNLVGSLGQALQQVTALLLVYAGARLILAGDLSIGALVACNILAARALAPMRQIFGAWHQLQQARDAFSRLDTLFTQPGDAVAIPAPGGGMLDLKGRIRVEAASFRYAPDRPPALADITLEVVPGTIMGIVGAPGSGKSTLVKLLLGLELPDSGRVLIDDIDLRRLQPSLYRGRMGIVPQEVQIFSGSIALNIGIGAADRSFARVIAAAKFVGLHEIVQRLPEGYETVLGERGAGLSLGQRQLIALARAIVRNPHILVLDEATSALDAASEAHFLANLRRAAKGRTILLVTHRASVLQAADRAVLMAEGRIVKIGTPAEVLSHQSSLRQPSLHAVR
jgi:ABC-type bacteriocin/lantibiotic exporter with double-glycine peptidase domain